MLHFVRVLFLFLFESDILEKVQKKKVKNKKCAERQFIQNGQRLFSSSNNNEDYQFQKNEKTPLFKVSVSGQRSNLSNPTHQERKKKSFKFFFFFLSPHQTPHRMFSGYQSTKVLSELYAKHTASGRSLRDLLVSDSSDRFQRLALSCGDVLVDLTKNIIDQNIVKALTELAAEAGLQYDSHQCHQSHQCHGCVGWWVWGVVWCVGRCIGAC